MGPSVKLASSSSSSSSSSTSTSGASWPRAGVNTVAGPRGGTTETIAASVGNLRGGSAGASIDAAAVGCGGRGGAGSGEALAGCRPAGIGVDAGTSGAAGCREGAAAAGAGEAEAEMDVAGPDGAAGDGDAVSGFRAAGRSGGVPIRELAAARSRLRAANGADAGASGWDGVRAIVRAVVRSGAFGPWFWRGALDVRDRAGVEGTRAGEGVEGWDGRPPSGWRGAVSRWRARLTCRREDGGRDAPARRDPERPFAILTLASTPSWQSPLSSITKEPGARFQTHPRGAAARRLLPGSRRMNPHAAGSLTQELFLCHSEQVGSRSRFPA